MGDVFGFLNVFLFFFLCICSTLSPVEILSHRFFVQAHRASILFQPGVPWRILTAAEKVLTWLTARQNAAYVRRVRAPSRVKSVRMLERDWVFVGWRNRSKCFAKTLPIPGWQNFWLVLEIFSVWKVLKTLCAGWPQPWAADQLVPGHEIRKCTRLVAPLSFWTCDCSIVPMEALLLAQQSNSNWELHFSCWKITTIIEN